MIRYFVKLVSFLVSITDEDWVSKVPSRKDLLRQGFPLGVAIHILGMYNNKSGTFMFCMGGWWRWAQVSPDGVAPRRMVDVSASVNLPLNHKVQKFCYGTGSPGWSRTKGRKTVMVWCFMFCILYSVSTKKNGPR